MVKENLQEVIHNMEIACKNSGRDMKDVTLIAVSKTKPNDLIMEVYESGIRDFGERCRIWSRKVKNCQKI